MNAREKLQATQLAVTRILAESPTPSEAYRGILQEVCQGLGWDVAAIWMVAPTESKLHCAGFWRDRTVAMTPFLSETWRVFLAKGIGLPGRVWRSGSALWIPDLQHARGLRKEAGLAGLRGASAFPVLSRGEVIGVIELLGRRVVPRDTEVVRAMEGLGLQLGQFVERKRREAEVRDSREQLRALSLRLQAVREEEGAKLARELHDELGQMLTALKMDISWLRSKLGPDARPLKTRAAAMIRQLDRSIDTVRRVCSSLRPVILEQLGLVAAVKWQARELEKRTGIRCRVLCTVSELEADAERDAALYRVLQEALTNVVRHAGATSIRLRLRKERDVLKLEVIDNGRGIGELRAAGSRALGILGMRERVGALGGEFQIVAVKSKGTALRVSVPVARRDAPDA